MSYASYKTTRLIVVLRGKDRKGKTLLHALLSVALPSLTSNNFVRIFVLIVFILSFIFLNFRFLFCDILSWLLSTVH